MSGRTEYLETDKNDLQEVRKRSARRANLSQRVSIFRTVEGSADKT